jgi:hypothetical protein
MDHKNAEISELTKNFLTQKILCERLQMALLVLLTDFLNYFHSKLIILNIRNSTVKSVFMSGYEVILRFTPLNEGYHLK